MYISKCYDCFLKVINRKRCFHFPETPTDIHFSRKGKLVIMVPEFHQAVVFTYLWIEVFFINSYVFLPIQVTEETEGTMKITDNTPHTSYKICQVYSTFYSQTKISYLIILGLRKIFIGLSIIGFKQQIIHWIYRLYKLNRYNLML